MYCMYATYKDNIKKRTLSKLPKGYSFPNDPNNGIVCFFKDKTKSNEIIEFDDFDAEVDYEYAQRVRKTVWCLSNKI